MENSERQSADEAAAIIPPRKSLAIDVLMRTDPNHPLVQKYLQAKENYDGKIQEIISRRPQKIEVELPELKPVDVESFYELFKVGFKVFRKKDFDENANDCEARKFARTLSAYFIERKDFVRSPLLNRKSEPSLQKGLMVIGDYGTGKTSVFKTFYEMFFRATNYPVPVFDVEGHQQILGRYNFGFRFSTANEAVKEYETLATPDDKDFFWSKYTKGMHYFDDIMTENQASNYGKIELFKDILEIRYSNSAKTLVSLNYVGDSVESTLDAFGERYGERVYDRLFEMFNIIELKGSSLRK